MSWAAVGGAAVSVVGGALMSDKKGGAGTTTASKEPWAAAAPWLEEQIKTGQDLQGQYQQTPFNAQQLAAYGDMGRQTGYMNNLVPDLLGQVSNQGLLGFDRSNPSARVKPYTFNGSGTGAVGGAQSGLLGQLTNPNTVSQYTSAANPPPAAPAPVAPAPAGQFEAFDESKVPLNDYARMAIGIRSGPGGAALPYNGGFGSFRYGDAAPQLGTQAYYDYQQFLQGGGDPLGLYSGTGSSGGA